MGGAIQVLDGGWKQWVADSNPVETKLPSAFPAADSKWKYEPCDSSTTATR